VPIQLNVSTGVGDSTLDFEKLNLSGLDVNAGTGNASITLPAQGTYDASIDAGVGDINISIPEGMPARVHANSGLGRIELPSNYARTGDTYESPGYNASKDHVNLEINGGVGNITVREVQP
jgi:hypothetical protein